MSTHDETTTTQQQMSPNAILSCNTCNNGNKVTVEFPTETFTFHAQWLYDGRCDDGAARNADSAIYQQPSTTVRVKDVHLSGKGMQQSLDVVWTNKQSSKFPIPAPLVAARAESSQPVSKRVIDKGWTVETLKIPEVSYGSLFGPDLSGEQVDATILSTLDKILSPSGPGIV